MLGFELIIITIMITINCMLAGYEIALASISLARLRVLANENKKGAKAALFLKENMGISLTTIQLGITLVGAIAAATGGSGAEAKIAPLFSDWFKISEGSAKILAIAAVVIPLTIVTILFGELIPKLFALRNKEWLCLKLSPIVHQFAFVLGPVARLFETGIIAIIHWGEQKWRLKFDEDFQVEVFILVLVTFRKTGLIW